MLKTEFVSRLAHNGNISLPMAQKLLNAFLDSIEDGLIKDGKISLKGFGSFSVVERKARTGRNLQTGENITIPESRTVRFTPAASLKNGVNDPA